MAYFAVVSLKIIIENYLIDHDTPLASPSREILEFAYKQIESSEEIAKRVFGSNGRRVVAGMKSAVDNLREALESHVSKQIDSQSDGTDNLEKEIHFFTEMMKKLEKEYADDLYNSFPQGEEDEGGDDEVPPPVMVGLSDQYNHLKEMLTNDWTTELQVVSLFGMPGIGKTTLAREIFEDADISQQFDCRVWVKAGRKCRSKEIPGRILAELKDQICVEDDEGFMNKTLKGKRYLIVLDDIWDKYMAEFLQTSVYSHRRNKSKQRFPDEQNGSRILLTSRLQQVDAYDRAAGETIEMRLMDEEESWLLLHELVFIEELCPWHLERLGRKIAKKCEGLPLTIVAVANLLSKEEKTAECWNEVATKKNGQLFKAAYDEISKVLFPSYKHLPRPLQMCFMFVGVFPQYYEIPRSKLINLCKADGFLEQDLNESTHHDETECLEEIASNSMLMINRNTLTATWKDIGEDIKTCRLHSSLWHLSNREGRRSKFAFVLNSIDDVLGEDIEMQQRLSFHNNVLFGIKGLNESVEDKCASTAQSLLCYGPYLQYQVPICFGLRLLRELDAFAIRFYEFPTEVLQLVELRYIALTLNGMLPPAISQLSNLQFLIVDRHLNIKSRRESSLLPMEIWSMKELQHLRVMGNDLPCPYAGASLKSLLTLSRVSPNSCTEEVFRAIPNLRKLGIQVELSPDTNESELPLNCLGHVHRIMMLKSLKCVVANPKAVLSLALPLLFPLCLTKLTLSGLGNQWEEMSMIPSLEFLRVLKLQNYAFRGPEWEVEDYKFFKLRSLIIEDTDLMKWKIGQGSFYCLESLSIKGCYKLKVICGEFGKYLEQIEMVDCNPSGVEGMKKATSAKVRVSCSWYDRKPKA